MDDPRDVFLRHVRKRKGFRVNNSYVAHRQEALLEALFYTIADYIDYERDRDDKGLGQLERLYACPQAFLDSEDPHEWLEKNRAVDDMGLIMFIYDHMYNMTPGKHRRTLLYLVNILDFD